MKYEANKESKNEKHVLFLEINSPEMLEVKWLMGFRFNLRSIEESSSAEKQATLFLR